MPKSRPPDAAGRARSDDGHAFGLRGLCHRAVKRGKDRPFPDRQFDVERIVNSQAMLTRRLTIPRFGQAESLNAGVATGILLDGWRRG